MVWDNVMGWEWDLCSLQCPKPVIAAVHGACIGGGGQDLGGGGYWGWGGAGGPRWAPLMAPWGPLCRC